MKGGEITSTVILLAIGAAAGYLAGISIPQADTEKQAHPSDGMLCPVMRVVDGDTIDVWFDGAVRSVRLLNIDTPEIDEPGYSRSTAALRDMLGRGPVILRGQDRGRLRRDAYGRLLAYVYIGSRCANVEMVRQGWSRYWTRYGQSRLADEFLEAETDARESGRGLWGLQGTDAEEQH